MHQIGIDSSPLGMIRQRVQHIGAQAHEQLCAAGRGIQSSKEFLASWFGCLMKGMGADGRKVDLVCVNGALNVRGVG